MAGELVKWLGNRLVRPSPSSAVQRCREAREAALSVLRPEPLTRPPASVRPAAPLRLYPGLPVDLPRMCALDGKPYAARYIFGNDGRFRLGSMIAPTEAIYLRRYAGNQNAVIVPTADLGEEICPLCGAFRAGHSAVLCGACKNEVCYGRTSGGYFRCFCGGEGVIKPVARIHTGVMPVRVR
jgi:hypothetical protein